MSDFGPPGFTEEQAARAALGLLGLLMTAGIWYPLKNRRMPNVLAIGGSALAVALQEWILRPHGFGAVLPGTAGAIAGLAVAAAAFLPLYLTGATTASDVKLMAMVGAFLGPFEVTGAILFTLLIGSLLALLCNVPRLARTRGVPCAVAIALGTAGWILLKA